MDSSQMGWMSLTNHHIFRMRFSEECDGLGCSGPVGSQHGWPSCLGSDSTGAHSLDKLQGGLCTSRGWAGRDVLTPVSSREPGTTPPFTGKK